MANIANQVAIVIGAGMGGLAVASALSDFFNPVIVLDRDTLPSEGVPRSGVPQGTHTHGLLVGGLRALQTLFPGIEEDFLAVGAVTMDAARDVRVERPGFDSFPASHSAVCRRLRLNSPCGGALRSLPKSNCMRTAARRRWSRRRTAARFMAFALQQTAARAALWPPIWWSMPRTGCSDT